MERSEIESRLKKALAKEFELDEATLTSDAHIKEDMGLDSLDIVDMVIVLEREFNFTIENKAALLHIQTLGDITGFIADTADAVKESGKGGT